MTSKWTTLLYREIGIALLIFCTPYLIYLPILFQGDSKIVSIFGFDFHHSFTDIESFLWLTLKKVIPIILLLIWFFTNRFWWRYAVLISLFPFGLTLIQMLTLVDSGSSFQDTYMYPVLLLILFYLLVFTVDKIGHGLNHENIMVSKLFLRKLHSVRRDYKSLKLKINSVPGFEKSETYELSYKMGLSAFIEKKYLQFKFRNGFVKSSIDVWICVFLVLIAASFYLWRIIPENTHSFELLFFEITNHLFPDVHTNAWFFLHNFCVLAPLTIWFWTEKKWWIYAILSPIILLLYGFWELYILEGSRIDEVEHIKSIPFIGIVLIILLLLGRLLFYKYKILDIYEIMQLEIETLLNVLQRQSDVAERRTLLTQLSKQPNSTQKLGDLKELRDGLAEQLNKITEK